MHNFIIVNGDTDSIAFKKPDETPFTPEEQEHLLAEINSQMPKGVEWKNDKTFRRFIVFAAKNYVLDDGKKVKIKGNSLKATKKAPELRAFIREIVDLLLKDKKEQVIFAYLAKAMQIGRLKSIAGWCFKATVTKKVLKPSEKATFQKKILSAIGDTPVSEGDKIYLFYREDESLCLEQDFKGDFSKDRLLGALKDTMQVFRRVLDVELFPDLTLKRNKALLSALGLKEAEPPKALPPVPSGGGGQKPSNAIFGSSSKTLTPPPGVKLTRI
jgi:hypothetical protein